MFFRVMLMIFIVLISADANMYKNVINSYKNKDYQYACNHGKRIFWKINKGSFTAIVGDACARVDNINILGDIIKHLNKNRADRINASYFATLILEKKLIYQFMNDGINLSNLSLPKTQNILSRVFDALVLKKYTVKNKKLKITDGNYSYVLWLSNDKPKKLYIYEYKNNKLIKRHWYR